MDEGARQLPPGVARARSSKHREDVVHRAAAYYELPMRARPLLGALGLALALLGGSAPAFGNGRFPAAGQLVVDPSSPEHLVLRATYGILSSQDAGQRWDWICEEAVGYGGIEDPSMGILSNGTLLAGIFAGLALSSDAGCGWSFAGGGLEGRFVVDVSVEKVDPSRAIFLLSNGLSATTFSTQVFETLDGAKTFQQAGVDLPTSIVGVTLDAAPSDPTRLYVTGRRDAPSYVGVLARSSDRGATWDIVDIPGADALASPFLAAVDPTDPQRIYVRLDGKDQDTLLASDDGGDTWTTVFTTPGRLLGFALSPDGQSLRFGSPEDGIYAADRAALAPMKLGSFGPLCLAWTADGLYACADQFKDDFVVGVSQDGGASFSPLLTLDGLCGPLPCPDGTATADLCTLTWGPTRATIGSKDCDGPEPPDAGATASSGSGGGHDDGGCQASAAGAGSGTAALLVALGALAARAARSGRRRGRGP